MTARRASSTTSRRRCSGSSGTAYIVWKAETADNRFELGTDTFIVRNGKIVTQTFAGKISRKQ